MVSTRSQDNVDDNKAGTCDEGSSSVGESKASSRRGEGPKQKKQKYNEKENEEKASDEKDGHADSKKKAKANNDNASEEKDDVKEEKANSNNDDLDSDGKPKPGVVSHETGKVEWKFAGGTYEGKLQPSKETKSKCVAKTHNGKDKTLKKDKDYWNVIQ